MKYAIKAVALGLSLLLVGVCYAQDFDKGMAAFDKKDYAAALREWRPLAEKGNANAQNSLGFMYEQGQGVAQDYKEAVKWFRLAAAQGNGSAQNSLGFLYDNGQGVTQDYKEAVKWYRLSAEQGNADAQLNLGALYFCSGSIKPDTNLGGNLTILNEVFNGKTTTYIFNRLQKRSGSLGGQPGLFY